MDVAKRLTFRIRGGMLMVGLNTQKENVHEGKKNAAATGGYSISQRSSTGMPCGAFSRASCSQDTS